MSPTAIRDGVLVLSCIALGAAGCASEGACAGHSDILDSEYCYDGWDRSECDEYDAEGVNDASWNFYPGDTCWDLGY